MLLIRLVAFASEPRILHSLSEFKFGIVFFFKRALITKPMCFSCLHQIPCEVVQTDLHQASISLKSV